MTEPAAPDLVGQTLLGKLEVERLLGAGGMGAVYQVKHKLTRHRRALKVLHHERRENANIVARFLREATVAGTLKTKHVVETFDAGQLEDGSPYVLMELLEGEPLSTAIDRGLSPGRIAAIVWEACEGLRVAHDAEIVHRDLKPDNIFLSRDDEGVARVKVLDFGISKFASTHDYAGTLTGDGTMMGTPYYMSPEQAAGQRDVDLRTDIYSLGVILYEAMAGRPPFEGDTFPALVIRIHNGDCPALSSLAPNADPGLVQVVERAMQKDRDERFSSAADLQRALRPFVSAETARSLPPRVAPDSPDVFGDTLDSDERAPAIPATRDIGAELVSPRRSTLWITVAAALMLAAVGITLAMAGGSSVEQPTPEPPSDATNPVTPVDVVAEAEDAASASIADTAPVDSPDASTNVREPQDRVPSMHMGGGIDRNIDLGAP